MPSKPSPEPALDPGRGLTRERIVDAAIELIELHGSHALSMRRLGADLGVEAMSLYHYVAGREDLVEAIGDRILEPLHDVDLEGGWRLAADRFATAVRAIAVARPATFRLVGVEPFDSAPSLRPVERLVASFIAEGFEPADALGIYRVVAAYARGYALAEATGFTVDAAQPRGRERLAALSPQDFPILGGRARELAALGPESGFRRGLEALLAGLAPPAPRRR